LKVCGLRQPAQAAAVAALGADAIGVIAVPSSPRWLEPGLRPPVFAAVQAGRADCLRVLVVADPSDHDLALLEPGRGGHNVLQLHGTETPDRCHQLRQRLPTDLRLWKALRIRSQRDLELASSYASVVDALLLDAWAPDQLGGTGHCLPLAWLADFTSDVPWWLAGGITPERVSPVLAAVRPVGLDVSSGVEDAPGLKNLDRVAALVEAISACQLPSSI
jgi:phosphoribosylanthranilate isomerase